MDIHIELQDTDARFSLFASSTYELAFGGLSVHMNADQFQQLCDNLRPWVVEDTTPHPSADAVREAARAEGAAAMRENMLGQVTTNASLRELVQRWRQKAKRTGAEDRADDAYENCADELESLLSGGSHA